MIDFLPPDGRRRAIISQLADPAIRIVSLTVTEGGYYIDPATGAFDPRTPTSPPTPPAPKRRRPCSA